MGIYNSECHASHGLSERFTTLEVKRGGKGTGMELQPRQRERPVPYRHHHPVLHRVCQDADPASALVGLPEGPAVVSPYGHRRVGSVSPRDARRNAMPGVVQPIELHAVERPYLLMPHTDPEDREGFRYLRLSSKEAERQGMLLHGAGTGREHYAVGTIQSARLDESLLRQHTHVSPAPLAEELGKVIDK